MIKSIVTEIRRLNCEMNFLMKSRGNVETIELERPPKDWDYIPGSTSDKWKFLETFSESTDMTACLYNGKKDSIIPAHKHPNQTEVISVENENGRILVITKTYEKELTFSDSITFNEDEEHIIIFLNDSTLLCRWIPRFKEDKIQAQL